MANKFFGKKIQLVTIFIFLIFLIIFLKYENGISNSTNSMALLDVNLSKLSVENDITDNDDKEIYIKNKTKFYIKNRTKYLLHRGIKYNDSKLLYVEELSFIFQSVTSSIILSFEIYHFNFIIKYHIFKFI